MVVGVESNRGQFCCCFVVIISMVVGVESNLGQFCCCFVVIISMVVGVESQKCGRLGDEIIIL
jgi:hypothetical protein